MEYCLSIFGLGESLEKIPSIDEDEDDNYFPFAPVAQVERLQDILMAKERGNEAFERKDYRTAIYEYSRGISLFEMSGKCSSEQESAGNETSPLLLLTMILSNRAAAYLKQFDYEKALFDARGIVIYRPDWAKGHFRKAEAYMGLRRFEQALESYTFASKYDPYNGIIRQRAAKAMIMLESEQEGFEIHQLSPGREICHPSIFTPIQSIIFESVAKQLKNFIYVLAHKQSRECILIDACWDIDGILRYLDQKGLTVVGAIITHYHVDHCGGIPPPPFDRYMVRVDGIAKLLYLRPNINVYANDVEIDAIIKSNPELQRSQFISTTMGSVLELPIESSLVMEYHRKTKIEFLHTPGHTPGSQCILVNGKRLFSGDTLFIQSCGRLDFPDSCKHSMYHSLQRTLAALDDHVAVFPGHEYGGDFTTIGFEKHRGLLREMSEDEFIAQF
jgi:glyoxylase-like metal-dependent hydrolase (beta-lactamase superfamily II)